MTTISKDAILAADDLPTEDVEVPEWGGTVTVRTMTGAERSDLEERVLKARGKGLEAPEDFKARLVQLTVLNGDGSLLFSPAEVPKLQQKSAKALNRIAEVALRLSGITEKDQEELLGNLPDAPASDSGTT